MFLTKTKYWYVEVNLAEACMGEGPLGGLGTSHVDISTSTESKICENKI